MKIECRFNRYTESGVVYSYEHKGQQYEVWIPKRDFSAERIPAPLMMTLYTTRKYKKVPDPAEYVKLVEENRLLQQRIGILEKREQEQRNKIMQALNL